MKFTDGFYAIGDFKKERLRICYTVRSLLAVEQER